MTGNRLGWVDTGRGTAILLVALYHSTRWMSTLGFDLQAWLDINNVVASMRMPLFFVLSGLFARKWLEGSWADLLHVKILLFAWVFLVWETLGSVVILAGLAARDEPANVLTSVRQLLWSPIDPRFELWFIWALALFFIAAKMTRRVDPRVQLTLAAALSMYALWNWLDTTTGPIGSAKYYFFFLAGIYMKRWILELGMTNRRWILSLLFALWATMSTTFYIYGVRDIFGMYFLNCLVGVTAGVAISRGLSKSSLLRDIGRRTLPVYLAHTPIIILLTVIASIPAIFNFLESVKPIVPLVTAAIAVACALALYTFSINHHLRFLYEPPAAVRNRLAPGRRGSTTN